MLAELKFIQALRKGTRVPIVPIVFVTEAHGIVSLLRKLLSMSVGCHCKLYKLSAPIIFVVFVFGCCRFFFFFFNTVLRKAVARLSRRKGETLGSIDVVRRRV